MFAINGKLFNLLMIDQSNCLPPNGRPPKPAPKPNEEAPNPRPNPRSPNEEILNKSFKSN